jgi:dihydrofolate synthase/folylpolyglutamate synthase
VAAARAAGIAAAPRASIAEAIDAATRSAPAGRVLICGSLYLAGRVLEENG